MPIPTFDKMLDPLLAIAAKEPLTRRTATTAMQQQFSLTEEERNARIPSGQSTVVGSRAGWAVTFLTKAGLIDLKSRLLDAILAQTPEFFERLVLDVLVAMATAVRVPMPPNILARAATKASTDG